MARWSTTKLFAMHYAHRYLITVVFAVDYESLDAMRLQAYFISARLSSTMALRHLASLGRRYLSICSIFFTYTYGVERRGVPYIFCKFLQVSQFSRDFYPFLGILTKKNLAKLRSNLRAQRDFLFPFFIFFFFIFLSEVDKSENSRWSGRNAIFAELRLFLRKLLALILFQID